MPRIDYTKVGGGASRAMYGLEKYLAESSVEKSLRNMIKVRASQINGCAYCIDMHWKDARVEGETEQRLYGLMAWRESPYYTERTALEWTEALTLVADNHVPDELYEHVPDELYEKVRREVREQEIVDLTLAIVTINAWNRIATSFRAEPGSYQPVSQTHESMQTTSAPQA